jgi:hypothetical protein
MEFKNPNFPPKALVLKDIIDNFLMAEFQSSTKIIENNPKSI